MAGDVISIDFGNNNSPATANWNEYNAGSGTLSNLIRISDGAGTRVGFTVTGIDGNGSNNLQGSGSSSSTIFEDHIFGNGNDNDTLTLTFSGLKESLTYDLFGGFFRDRAAFEHTWNVCWLRENQYCERRQR